VPHEQADADTKRGGYIVDIRFLVDIINLG
jgi:hypothetical protein